MRLYCWGNMYLSSIQQGIQAAHVVGELSTKYPRESKYLDWAFDHKTIILLNGGMNSNILSIINHFDTDENPYEWAFFKESDDALNGLISCVGIVVPEKVYENTALMRKGDIFGIRASEWEWELMNIMNSAKLAT